MFSSDSEALPLLMGNRYGVDEEQLLVSTSRADVRFKRCEGRVTRPNNKYAEPEAQGFCEQAPPSGNPITAATIDVRKLKHCVWWHRFRGAILLLLWNFIILFVLITLEAALYSTITGQVGNVVTSTLLFRFNYSGFIFYPLAGLTADLLCGRYAVIMFSVAASIALLTIGVVLEMLIVIGHFVNLAIPILSFAVMVMVLHSFFQANALQFGADQLQDASSEELRSFIYWFVWVYNLAQIAIVFVKNSYIQYPLNDVVSVVTTGLAVAVLVGGALLLICHCMRLNLATWYIREPPSRNPYVTLCQILCFIRKHKVPIQRSSLTYWEEGLPPRMDFPKSKYGGPFSDEQVEDVKTLLGVSLLLLFLGFFGFIQVAANPHPVFVKHIGQEDGFKLTSTLLASYTLVTVMVILSLYEGLHRYCKCCHLPSMIFRLRLAIFVYVACISMNLMLDLIWHMQSKNALCMFGDNNTNMSLSYVHSAWVFFPALLSSLAYVTITLSSMEFIIAQSPYAMRGMLIGLYFFSQGTFGLWQ